MVDLVLVVGKEEMVLGLDLDLQLDLLRFQ